jgi:Cu-Zn family superoxide dismutase
MNTTRFVTFGLCVGCVAGIACSHHGTRDAKTVPAATTSEEAAPAVSNEPRRASTTLETTEATELQGTASFEETDDGVHVVLHVEHAKPGMQAVHVHERGDCSDIAGKSMGEHLAPDHSQHALPDTPERHLGDLGNIEIDESGKGTLEIEAPRATLKPDDEHSLLGKALVIHEKKDLGTQPSGDAGTPVACGVIKQ